MMNKNIVKYVFDISGCHDAVEKGYLYLIIITTIVGSIPTRSNKLLSFLRSINKSASQHERGAKIEYVCN